MVLPGRDLPVTILVFAGALLLGDGGGAVPEGAWGGVGVSLRVSASGAEIEFDCGRGTLGAPLRFGADGRFDVSGRYVPGRPGPARPGDSEASGRDASYRGRVDGDTLTLEVLPSGSGRALGPFSLRRGATPRLRKCG
jgi:hypothetical protein